MASAAAAKRRYPALAANHRYALTVNNSTGERLRGIEAQRFSLLRNVIQLAFLYDPLVRFIGALNPILIVIACGRQKLRDPVDALYTAAAEWRGRKAYRLTDFKFVLAHRAVHHAYLASRSTFAEELDFDCRPYRNTTARNVEPFNGLYHSRSKACLRRQNWGIRPCIFRSVF